MLLFARDAGDRLLVHVVVVHRSRNLLDHLAGVLVGVLGVRDVRRVLTSLVLLDDDEAGGSLVRATFHSLLGGDQRVVHLIANFLLVSGLGLVRRGLGRSLSTHGRAAVKVSLGHGLVIGDLAGGFGGRLQANHVAVDPLVVNCVATTEVDLRSEPLGHTVGDVRVVGVGVPSVLDVAALADDALGRVDRSPGLAIVVLVAHRSGGGNRGGRGVRAGNRLVFLFADEAEKNDGVTVFVSAFVDLHRERGFRLRRNCQVEVAALFAVSLKSEGDLMHLDRAVFQHLGDAGDDFQALGEFARTSQAGERHVDAEQRVDLVGHARHGQAGVVVAVKQVHVATLLFDVFRLVLLFGGLLVRLIRVVRSRDPDQASGLAVVVLGLVSFVLVRLVGENVDGLGLVVGLVLVGVATLVEDARDDPVQVNVGLEFHLVDAEHLLARVVQVDRVDQLVAVVLGAVDAEDGSAQKGEATEGEGCAGEEATVATTTLLVAGLVVRGLVVVVLRRLVARGFRLILVLVILGDVHLLNALVRVLVLGLFVTHGSAPFNEACGMSGARLYQAVQDVL